MIPNDNDEDRIESDHEGHYDMSLPVYQDIHNIMSDCVAITQAMFQYERYLLVDEYQSGRMTLDEVVDEIQRKADIMLNE